MKTECKEMNLNVYSKKQEVMEFPGIDQLGQRLLWTERELKKAGIFKIYLLKYLKGITKIWIRKLTGSVSFVELYKAYIR
jgi:hypothetical protein